MGGGGGALDAASVGGMTAGAIGEPQVLQKLDPSRFSCPFGQRTISISGSYRGLAARSILQRSLRGQPSNGASAERGSAEGPFRSGPTSRARRAIAGPSSSRCSPLLPHAGVTPIGLHGARHSYAELALGAGVRLDVVSRTLGHASAAFTADQYSHDSDAAAAEAAEIVGRAIGARGEILGK